MPGTGDVAAAAPPGRRLAAWGIDTGLLAGAAVLLGVMTWGRLNGIREDGLWGRVWSAVWGLLLSGGDVQGAAEDFGVSIWRTIVGDIQQALFLLVLIEFLHQFAGQLFAGRTAGKAVLDLRVENARTAKSVALRRALTTTAGGTGLYCLAWVLLLHGVFFLAVLTWMLAVGVLVANSVPVLFGGRRRTLADMVAGTVVVPGHGYRRAAGYAAHGAGRAWAGTRSAGQAAGHAVRDQAARLNAEDRVRRAMDSDRARQAQELGRRSAAKLRDAAQGERAQQLQHKGKRLGGRLKNAYTDRRASRQGPSAPTNTPTNTPPPMPPPAIPPPAPHYDPYTQPEPSTRPDQYARRPDPYWPPDGPPPGGSG
ncbi:RDD family protein [Spirillospora sp. NBC_00431]